MRIREEEPSEENLVNQMLGATRSGYRRFSDYVAFRPDDPLWMVLYKIFFRLVGFGFFLLISPFILLGLIIALLAVL
jgi:hypothetical protein